MNFDDVKAASATIMTQPGTIGVFKIAKVEFGESTNKKTRYMKCTFEDKDSSFSHSFYMTAKALSRVQSLAEAALGATLSGNNSDEQLSVKFTGKELALKVTGQVSDAGKGYPNLSFGGFCKKKDEVQFLSFNVKEQDEIEAAKAAMSRNASSSADSEPELAVAAGAEKW